MGNYLESLAARALGVATVVRPRPAARFEAQPVAEPETHTGPPGGPRAVASRSRLGAPAVNRAPPSPAHAAYDGTGFDGPREPGSGEPRGRLAASSDSHRHVPDATPSLAAAARTPPITAPAQAEPTLARSAQEPQSRSDVVRPRAVRVPARARAPAPAPSRRQRAEPPPVQVTIGRIEVRAVAPAAPVVPPRAPRRPTPMSLDEYLEQRRSERR